MMEKCFITGLACKGVACEGIYHEATQQCKLVMAINRYLGHIDGPVKTETPPPKPDSPLVSDAMTAVPDISGIKWMVKGNKDARDTDKFAYGFAFKYQSDEMRPEAAALYNYLQTHEALVIGEFTYSLSGDDKHLFARNKAKE